MKPDEAKRERFFVRAASINQTDDVAMEVPFPLWRGYVEQQKKLPPLPPPFIRHVAFEPNKGRSDCVFHSGAAYVSGRTLCAQHFSV